MAEKLLLGGRTYVPAGVGTVKHDLFIMQHARHAGLVGVSIKEGESPEQFAARLLDTMLASGRALLLLGALLLPEGSTVDDWTDEMAFQTAGHLGAIKDPAEKQKLYTELLSAVMGFFENGLGSWIDSQRSSSEAAEPPSSKTSLHGSESGIDSSGDSPSTTPTASTASSHGD